jgi:hypothetical protein
MNLEDYIMHHTRRYVAALFLAAALAAPLSIMAAPSPQGATVQVRVYDRSHRDYHNWDDRENQSWGVYLSNNHRRHYEYAKANRREQDRYWNWRHAHPDGR